METLITPLTFSNPRWEAFALSIAAGASAEHAYADAGFSDKNRKTRAHALAENPLMKSRVTYLRSCLPRLFELKQNYAPSHLLVPRSREEMIDWLWQVTNGARKIPPMQLRAANLLIRLKGWHLHDHIPEAFRHAPPAVHSNQERHLLAEFSRLTAETDTAGHILPESATRRLYSALADAALTPHKPQEPSVALAKEGEPKSPSNPLEPQPLSTSKSPNGDKKPSGKPAAASAEDEPNPPSTRELDTLLRTRHPTPNTPNPVCIQDHNRELRSTLEAQKKLFAKYPEYRPKPGAIPGPIPSPAANPVPKSP